MRANWYDAEHERPVIEEQIHHLQGYLDALNDGRIDDRELRTQEKRVVEAMRSLEPALDDAQHALVTDVLLELTAYNVMRILRILEDRRRATER